MEPLTATFVTDRVAPPSVTVKAEVAGTLPVSSDSPKVSVSVVPVAARAVTVGAVVSTMKLRIAEELAEVSELGAASVAVARQ